MAKRALITGITGQDGAYLSRLLLEQGYEVFGAYRRSASVNTWRLDELAVTDQVRLVAIDLLEFTNILREVEKVAPDEIYNLAAQSFVALSFEQPIYTSDVDALGVARLLEVVRTLNPAIRVYQASSSEMFGKAQQTPQSEHTPFYPRSPYGVAKLYAHWMTVNAREAYGIHASSGILFNHESPLRGLEFATRKLTAAFARIRHGQQDCVEMGNLDPKRDWGFAGDYVHGMWLMLQQPEPDDYVLATGHTHSIREFAQAAGEAAGFHLEWQGQGVDLTAVDRHTGRTILRINPDFYRPSDVDMLIGDAAKARTALEWRPTVDFAGLVQMMVEADLRRAAVGELRS